MYASLVIIYIKTTKDVPMSSYIQRYDNPSDLDHSVVTTQSHIQAMKPEKPDKTLLALIFIFMHQIFPYKRNPKFNS